MGEELRQQIGQVEAICCLIENEQEYIGELTGYLPMLNQTISNLLTASQDSGAPFTLDGPSVIQLLKDILYGIEQRDSVILLDALRYGLLKLYYCVDDILRMGASHE